jgi:hypothetical protein
MRLPVFLSALLVALGAAQASGETKLAGTTWLMSSAGKRAPSISFASDGKVAGSGGCNRFFGSYMQEGEKLSFSPLGSTRMACPQGIMKREQACLILIPAPEVYGSHCPPRHLWRAVAAVGSQSAGSQRTVKK